MFSNNLKLALRYLVKHKGYSLINVLGLSVGIACCLLIMLFVRSEWSFDRFHGKKDRIYRAWLQEHYEGQLFTNVVTPIPLGPVLQEGLPEVESSCRVSLLRPSIFHNNNTFSDPVNMVDSTFFKIFDFPLVEGAVSDPLARNNSMVITRDAEKKYFGKESALGKTLSLQLGNDTVQFTVTAIAKNVPLESSIQFDMLIPFSNAKYIWGEKTRTSGWSNVGVESYFLLKEGAKLPTVQSKIPAIMNPLVAKTYKPGEYQVTLQPITDIHLNNSLPEGNEPVSDPKYSYIMATIGIIILLIACINFVTLSIGRSATRAMEVGIRKVLGAEKQQLIRLYWGEAMMLTIIAVVAGGGFALLLQKPFNSLANRELHFSADVFTILFCLLIMALIAAVAGLYPAFVLSSFRPIQVLKGRFKGGSNMGVFRKALIIGQFVASISMIIATVTVGDQLKYLRTKDLGFNREYVIVVPTNQNRREGARLAQRFEVEAAKNPQVMGTTTSLYSMAEYGWMNLGYMDDKKQFRQFQFNAVDADFTKTMNIQMVAGRGYSTDTPADSNYILVNEALVKEYGWKNPVGMQLPGNYPQRVLGVMKDFHVDPLHTPIKPLVVALKPDSIFAGSSDVSYATSPEPRVSIRFRGGDLQAQIEFLRTTWKSVAGNQDFEYQFLDEALNAAYEQESRLGKIVEYASVLSVFIACMGLFGLATLVVVRRTKEIGIRKVLGANVTRIVALLSKDFIVLVFLAALIAFPLAWIGLHKWLQDFAYRINISWIAFLAAALLTLIVAVVTVSLQAIKAALTNPVKSLRTE